MSEDRVPQSIEQRLHANIEQAGMQITAEDLAEMQARGYFQVVEDFERLVATYPADLVPDYLGEQAPPSVGETTAPAWVAQAPIGRYPPLPPAGLRPGEDADFRSIAELASLLRDRHVSPVEMTERALRAIEQHDGALNAFQVVLGERALAAARRAEAEIAAGTYRGTLHGVPLAVKDLLAMRGTQTTAGTRVLAGGTRSDLDAAAVERLEEAGAVIIGKTRLSEGAYSPGSNNAHYGPTHNPWHLAHDTGGSSSGSAAAVAAGLVPGALGSDTGGSIRIPAAYCGLVGLKPTYGRVSLHGAITLSWSLDHLGPLTRTVADTAILLDALAGPDPRDPRSRAAPPVRYAPEGARGLRIGVLREAGSAVMPASPEAHTAWRAGLAALEGAGATLIEISLPELADAELLNSTILVLEGIAFHQQFLKGRRDEYGEFPRRRLMRAYAFGPDAFVRAQQGRAVVRRRCAMIFETVDLLSTPTMPSAAPPLGVPGKVTFTAPFNLLGWPAISMPAGRTDEGLPLGLQLVGKPWDEGTVLRAAAGLEATGIWLRPAE